MSSFLQELQRRSVFRVAAAYLVVGWLITQAVAIIETPLHLPEWTDTLVIVLLLCGLPIALILAWAFEVTPEGVKRTASVEPAEAGSGASHILDYAILGILVLVAGLIGWQQISGPGNNPVSDPRQIAANEPTADENAATGDVVNVVTPVGTHATGAPQSDPRNNPAAESAADLSVAVLPFAAFSADVEDGYFADGLTEEILNSLAGIPELLVTSRTSAFQFRGDNIPSVPEIARSLGVAHVLEGSVRRSGEQVRVTAQLIRASDDRHLWSQTYDRTMEDVFTIQEDIAENVAAVLQIVLDETRRERMRNSGTRNFDAYIAYQQGAALWVAAHNGDEQLEELEQSAGFFERAAQLAPDFSEAYLLHSDWFAHQLVEMAETGDQMDGDEFDRLNTRRAELVALAVQTAGTPSRRAMAEANEIVFSDDWQAARAIIRDAFATDECANDNWLQFLITVSGDLDGRLAYAQRQVRCDPLNGQTQLLLGDTLLARGDYAEALEQADRMDERELTFEAEVIRFDALLGLGRLDDAEAMLGENWDWERLRLTAFRGDSASVRSQAEGFLGESGWFDMILSALAGDRAEANALAAQIDARPLGTIALMDALMTCRCGAVFDLASTPNFAARLSEAGFPWPPAGDLGFSTMED